MNEKPELLASRVEDGLVFEESHIQPRTLGYVPRGSNYFLPNLVSCEMDDTKEDRVWNTT